MERYIIIFIIFSFLGWVWESIYCTICHKKWASRGFLYGAICPIYGFGSLLCLGLYDLNNAGIIPILPWWGIFIAGFLASMVLEYPTSWALEKKFNARWWDYSKVPMNINGRTSVPTSVAFGVMAIFLLNFMIPFFVEIISTLPVWLISLFSYVFVMLISVDLTLTLCALIDFQSKINLLDNSFQNHMTEAVEKARSAQNALYARAVKRIKILKIPNKNHKNNNTKHR